MYDEAGGVVNMKIVIVGAGAVGGYFGARLHEAGANVTFFVRENRAKQLKHNGLHINSVKGNSIWEQPSYITDTNDIKDVDLVILATKGYHLENSINSWKALISDRTFLLPLLNGVKHYSILFEQFGKEKVIGGLANIVSTLDDVGHVIHTSKVDKITFGTLHPQQEPICETLAKWTSQANIQATYSDKISEAIWEKYMFITAFSGVTTASDVTTGPIREVGVTKDTFMQLLQEMKAIANAEGVALTDKHIETAWKTMEVLPEQSTSSMHQDFRKGLPIEVDYLQGFALQLAQQHQLDVPVLQTIYAMIKAKSYQT